MSWLCKSISQNLSLDVHLKTETRWPSLGQKQDPGSPEFKLNCQPLNRYSRFAL